MALVSVVIPIYKAEKYLVQAVESVLKQTVKDIEVILIDDKSPDNSYEMIKKIASSDDRVKVYQNNVNSGVSYTRNFGVKVAQSDWIAFLDSDDYWEPTKLEKQLPVHLNDRNIVLSCTGTRFMKDNGELYEYIMPVKKNIVFSELLKKNTISCSSVIARRDVMQNFKFAGDKMHEDYTAWLGIVKEYGSAYGVNEPLLVYRLTNNSKSSGRIKSAKMIYRSYRAIGLNAIKSTFCMLRYAIHSISYRSNFK